MNKIKNRNNLENVRLAKKLTRAQLAERVGVTETTIYRKERGKRGLSDVEAPFYAKALNVPVEELFINPKLFIPKAPDNNFREIDVAVLDIFKIILKSLAAGKTTRDFLDKYLANQETKYMEAGLKGAAPLIYALRESLSAELPQVNPPTEKPLSRRDSIESDE